MSKIRSVTGSVVEAARFVNANKRGAPLWTFPERRELWLQTPQGKERKFVIHTRALPARRGHRLVLLVHEEAVVGVFNLTTGDAVNYTREDPVGLLHFKDFLLAVVVAAGGVFTEGERGLLAGPTAWLLIWTGRLLRRSLLQRRVDAALKGLSQRSAEGSIQ